MNPTTSASNPVPSPAASSGGSGFVLLARRFIEGNYFYVASAMLFLLGCKLLMNSPMIGESNFARTLHTLLVLQGYEVLVIAAAVMIARHFKVLNDAFTLLIIELTLLLDPTFFSNSFFTMLITESQAEQAVMVNVVCLLLVPAKLIILSGLARIRLSARVWLGIGAAAALIYIGPYPFSSQALPFDEYGYYAYYALGWGVLIVALLMPPVAEAVVKSGNAPEGFLTAGQGRWLPRFAVLLPQVILAMHYAEHLWVHPIRFYWMFAGPPLLGLGAVIMMNARRDDDGARGAVAAMDAMVVAVLLMTFGSSMTQGKEIVKAQVRLYPSAPDFFMSPAPLALAGVAIIGLYIMAFFRLGYKPALWRAAALSVCGMAGGLVKSGVFAIIGGWLGDMAKWAGGELSWLGTMIKRFAEWIGSGASAAGQAGVEVIAAYPWLAAGMAGLVLLAMAWRWKNLFTWMLAGLFWIVFGLAALPGAFMSWIFEGAQIACAWLIVCYLRFGDPRKERWVAAALMVGIGFARYLVVRDYATLGMAAAEGAALLMLGWWRRDGGLGAIGTAQLLALTGWLGRGLPALVSPSVAIITVGLALFVVGLVVTFRKEIILGKILAWDARKCDPVEPAPPPPNEHE